MQDAWSLSALQLSAVQELANIGLGRAATSLSEMTGMTFDLNVPEVHQVGLESLPQLFKGPGGLSAAVYTPCFGDFEGHLAFVFDWESTQSICWALLGAAPETPDDVNELHGSVVMELGNILNSSFLNAIGELTGIVVHIAPPLASFDDAGAILSAIAGEAEMQGAMALSVDTMMEARDNIKLRGAFLMIPGSQGLANVLRSLGLEDAA